MNSGAAERRAVSRRSRCWTSYKDETVQLSSHVDLKNLEFILDASTSAGDVHPVTQTVSALLAIIVFPWEKNAINAVKNKRLVVANSEGWPAWDMSGRLVDSNKVKTIGNLIELLRNSIAHGNVTFDSDPENPQRS